MCKRLLSGVKFMGSSNVGGERARGDGKQTRGRERGENATAEAQTGPSCYPPGLLSVTHIMTIN